MSTMYSPSGPSRARSLTGPCHQGGAGRLTSSLAADGQACLGIEELHVFDVDAEGHPVPDLDRGLSFDAGHPLALAYGLGLVFIESPLGYDPVRVDGEVDHQLGAERLDEVHVTDESRASLARLRRGQVLGTHAHHDILARVRNQGRTLGPDGV